MFKRLGITFMVLLVHITQLLFKPICLIHKCLVIEEIDLETIFQ